MLSALASLASAGPVPGLSFGLKQKPSRLAAFQTLSPLKSFGRGDARRQAVSTREATMGVGHSALRKLVVGSHTCGSPCGPTAVHTARTSLCTAGGESHRSKQSCIANLVASSIWWRAESFQATLGKLLAFLVAMVIGSSTPQMARAATAEMQSLESQPTLPRHAEAGGGGGGSWHEEDVDAKESEFVHWASRSRLATIWKDGERLPGLPLTRLKDWTLVTRIPEPQQPPAMTENARLEDTVGNSEVKVCCSEERKQGKKMSAFVEPLSVNDVPKSKFVKTSRLGLSPEALVLKLPPGKSRNADAFAN